MTRARSGPHRTTKTSFSRFLPANQRDPPIALIGGDGRRPRI